MNAAVSSGPAHTQVTQTTLFDLMSAMQEEATTPLEEALIVPKVVDLMRHGRIRLEPTLSLPSVA